MYTYMYINIHTHIFLFYTYVRICIIINIRPPYDTYVSTLYSVVHLPCIIQNFPP